MRIDATSTDEREKLKEEIRSDLRREARRRQLFGCLFSLLLTLALTVAPFVWLGAMVAKSGMAEVPVLSSRMFHPGTPSREVMPLAGSTPQQISSVIGTRTKFDPATNKASVRITEQELTTLVSASLSAQPKDSMPFEVKSAQVAIDKEGMELFMLVPREARETTVKAHFVPTIDRGEFSAEVTSMEVGALKVPSKLAQPMFAAFGSYALQSVQDAIGATGTLSGITLEENAVTFVITVKR